VTYSTRIFVFGSDDTLYRLPGTKFTGMLDRPSRYCIPFFAGQRVRMVETVVEVQNRVPSRVVQLTCDMLTFDDEGRLDSKAFQRQQAARAELALFAPERSGTTIVDASSRFVAKGGRWLPSPSLARLIRQAALGKIKCQSV
jgi:hypothetical protein